MDKVISVAIDGPAAAGKSTVAKKVASALNFTYIDTGAMYRAFTYAVIKKGLDPKSEEQSVTLIPGMSIELLEDGRVICNNEDVSKVIREPLVSGNVSYIAAMKPVRLALVEMQRAMAEKKSVVMDGRDIGTYVLPDAEVKIYQIASVETRAVRRYEENLEKGINTTLKEVEEDVRKRDYIDSHREFAPLKPAPDSVLIDTSYMNVDQVVSRILAVIKEKTGIETENICH
ncbi:MAG: (d)CMP kinase [Bacilli bacterium]|nr:(d)CMP kinase [Bacilli bacterium]MCH4210942.1 (d)CMP kinase [Bacilli bacterium]MCH4229076.1 (d)CMP kinase [Bacilli bacterium]MCH4277772.1 (d)CMP kinase [Bacilli bacterium]MCI2054984.1 (d)CMP kinase [Bacilli bacterium]